MAIKKIMYVPLDNRPVNTYNVEMVAKTAGYEVIMPPKSYIETKLDQNTSGTGFKYGQPSSVVSWIRSNMHSVDAFIISADMLASGGLVGSRALNQPISLAQAKTNLNVIKELPSNKPVYVFDTIMRLASTSGVDGLTTTDYNRYRDWAKLPRQARYDFDDIKLGYKTAPNGTTIADPSGISATNVNKYITARQRKFDLNLHVMDLGEQGYIDFLVYGIDDASTTGVQINEIGWLESKIPWRLSGGDAEAQMMPDADGLGVALVGRMAQKDYASHYPIKVSITYYGGSGTSHTDPFENMTMDANLRRHIKLAGATVTTLANADVDIIVALPGLSSSEQQNAIWRITNNEQALRRTILIDANLYNPNATFGSRVINESVLVRLMAYSGWNTFGNKTGLALGHGLARYTYLRFGNDTDANHINATNAHATYLYKSFVKDYGYKARPQGSSSSMKVYMDEYVKRPAYARPGYESMVPNNIRAYSIDPGKCINDASWELGYRMGLWEDSTLFPRFANATILNKLSSTGQTTYFRNVNATKGNTAYNGGDGTLAFPWERTFEINVRPNLTTR